MSKTNVLVTGGAGFIGSYLCKALVQGGYTVTVLDNLAEQIHGSTPETTSPLYQSIQGDVHFIKGSVTDYDTLKKAIQHQEIVVHLAAETGTGQSMYQISHYNHVNVLGTANLLDILANQHHRVKKVVVASSRAIYGEGKYQNVAGDFFFPPHRQKEQLDRGDFEIYDTNNQEPLLAVATDEEAKIHPSSVYGITKQIQEQLIMTVCPTIGIAPVAFRYQNVYGPGQSLKNPYTGILSIFSNLIRNREEINIFEDGLESRDFVYIDDVITATMLGIEKEAANGEIFNVGTGVSTTVHQVAQQLIDEFNVDLPVHISGNYRLGDIRHNFADLSKIKKILAFTPVTDFSKGLKHFTAWVKEQALENSPYQESLTIMKQKGLFK